MSSAVAALMAFSVQAAYGAPARSTQTLRAMSCCSRHCEHPRTPAAAGHCCGVAGAASEVGISSQTKAADGAGAMHAVAVGSHAVASVDGARTGWVGATPEPRARSSPLFLLTHSLRV